MSPKDKQRQKLQAVQCLQKLLGYVEHLDRPVEKRSAAADRLSDLKTLLGHIDISQPLQKRSFRKGGFFFEKVRYFFMRLFQPLTKIFLARQIELNQINAYLLCHCIDLERRIDVLEKKTRDGI